MAEINIRISDRVLKVVGTLLTVVFLLWFFSHLWESGVLRAKYQLRLFVPAAQDLQVGAAVKLDGLPVGTVSAVELAPNAADSNLRIEVVLRIDKRFQNLIREDSSAALMTESLLGGKVVNIRRGFAGLPINAGGEIRVLPVKEATLTDFLDVLGKKVGCQNEVSNPPDTKSSASTKPASATH